MADAVFFDLDGTLADTAPDFARILHRMQIEHGLAPTPFEAVRAQVSHGVRGMLGVGFGILPDAGTYPGLAARFLELYAEGLCIRTCLFPGMAELLAHLERHGVPWGIVTNKPERYTHPLIAALGLTARSACIVGGDTAARAKPHPDPLLHACAAIDVEPTRCLYVGDDIRDITAGKAAGMKTLAAAYGYLGTDDPIHTWGAHSIIAHPMDVLPHLA